MSTTEWILLGSSLFACWRWGKARLECQGIYQRAADELRALRATPAPPGDVQRIEAEIRFVQALRRVTGIR